MNSGAPPTALYPGDQLDRYELLCPLAQGGMAAVWLARLHGKHGFQKLFAVKFILPQYAADVRFQQMFLDEARIASGIAHPFVANILDLGEERGILYIVMDWVDGDSLSRLIASVGRARQRIPANIAVRIAADVAGALHAAHELHDSDGRSLGVVHRDVSPSNVLLTTKGSPKVIDFGIAKAVVRLTQETGAGLMKGKVMYMAPEQAMGKPVDRRADVWAVAAVLHTMLAGDPPFTGDNEMAMLHRLTSGSIPNALPLTVPPNVRGILKAAMRFDRNERIGTCAVLQEALEAALVENKTPTTHSDVAAYSAQFLGEVSAQRHEAVRAALDEAGTRTSMRPQTGSGSLTPPAFADRSSKTPGQPFPVPAQAGRPSTGRNPAPMPILVSTPSISGPSLTTPPTSGPSTSESPRRGATLFVAAAVAAGALAVTSWALLRSQGPSASASAVLAAAATGTAGAAGIADPAASDAGSAIAPALVVEQTVNAPSVTVPIPAAANPFLPGAAASPATASVGVAPPPLPLPAVKGHPAGPTAAAAPPVLAVTTPPPAAVPMPFPLPVVPPPVIAAPVPAPAPAPVPVAVPQVVFNPDAGKVTVGAVDVDRVTARSVNGLLRHVSLDRCYVTGLRARGSAASGTAVLVLDIDQNQVSRAHLQSDLGLPTLRTCIESQFASLRVDDADTGSATARITLTFTP